MGITIKEIAKLTGVSRGTVDRALNNRGQVAPDIKAKILKVAKDHGYQKNLIASRLAKKETIKVAVILPDPKQDPFWADHYNGIKNLDKTFEDYGIKIIHYRFDQFSASSYSSTFRQVILDKPSYASTPTSAIKVTSHISDRTLLKVAKSLAAYSA